MAGLAYRINALSRSGAIAAIFLGTIIVGTGGWWPGIILIAFFATSSLISRSRNSSGACRNWLQVIANGWGMLTGCVLFAMTDWEPWLLFGIGAVAAATADTWSSELGRRSHSPPRMITTWRPVPPGTSGAVSAVGLVATFAGAGFIAAIVTIAVATDSLSLGPEAVAVLFWITLAGVSGGIIDSLLGATIQERRWCETCVKATEANPHRCGTNTEHIGGIKGFNNDVVNTLCSLTGALVGVVSGIL